MRFTYFEFNNFKGISHLRIDLESSNEANVYALVGLNESGKTTILEAINYFVYKIESLDGLELDRYKVKDIHDLIPINKRDNFNDDISISAGLKFEDNDIEKIKKVLKKELPSLKEVEVDECISFTQTYSFENSKHNKKKDSLIWTPIFKGIKKRAKTWKKLANDEALKANSAIKGMIPSILYFPNFLFEFPDKIFLDVGKNEKESYYKQVIQDLLDSLDNDLNIQDHLINRIQSDDPNDQRNLKSVLNKLNRKLTQTIFSAWNKIFDKEISDKEIILLYGVHKERPYLEFNIQDNVDTYRVHERSLGFRWFFVFLLLTQSRNVRKGKNKPLFLLDEPASNLHPSAQSQLLKSFTNLSKVIYTTHSHYLINPRWLEQTFVVRNKGIDYENDENFSTRKTDIEVQRYRNFATNHPHQSTYFQPILEVLDYAPSEFDLIPQALIVEGKSDFYFYKYYSEVLSSMDYDLTIIPGTSASNLEILISLYLGWNKKFVVLLDSDSEGRLQKKRYLDLYGPLLDAVIIDYKSIDAMWNNHGLEKLLPKDDLLKVLKAKYPASRRFNKKNFNRSVQELLIKGEKIDISPEGNSILHKILSTVMVKLR